MQILRQNYEAANVASVAKNHILRSIAPLAKKRRNPAVISTLSDVAIAEELFFANNDYLFTALVYTAALCEVIEEDV